MASEDIPANGHGGSANPSSDTQNLKNSLRQELRKRRQQFVINRENLILEAPAQVCDRFVSCLRGAPVVASYAPERSEADPSFLAGLALASGCIIALPATSSRVAPLVFRRADAQHPLERSPLGFLQPPEAAPEIEPDLILAPLVGFDRAMHRLGQGAGHYDRAFARWPGAFRVGVAWSVQEVDHLPADPWDMPLDAIVTEREWITGPASRPARGG